MLGRLKLSALWLYNETIGECTTKKWIWECRLVDVCAFTRSFLKQMPHPQPLQARNGNWNITTSLRDTHGRFVVALSMPSTIGVNPWKLMLWQLWRRHAYVGKKAFVQLVLKAIVDQWSIVFHQKNWLPQLVHISSLKYMVQQVFYALYMTSVLFLKDVIWLLLQ